MLFQKLAPILLAVSANCANIVLPRDAASIESSLNTVSRDIANLNNSLATFNGGPAGLFQALAIQLEASQTANDVNSAANTSNSSTPLDDSGSRAVAFQIVAIQDQIYQVLDLLVSKHAAFESTLSGSSSLVENDLQSLKNATDALGRALSPKLVPAVQKLAPLLLSDIDYHFVKAIQAYNTTGANSSASSSSSSSAPALSLPTSLL